MLTLINGDIIRPVDGDIKFDDGVTSRQLIGNGNLGASFEHNDTITVSDLKVT